MKYLSYNANTDKNKTITAYLYLKYPYSLFFAVCFSLRRYAYQVCSIFILKEDRKDVTELHLSSRKKWNVILAQSLKILSLYDTKFIEKKELKLDTKESQLGISEVMELCRE